MQLKYIRCERLWTWTEFQPSKKTIDELEFHKRGSGEKQTKSHAHILHKCGVSRHTRYATHEFRSNGRKKALYAQNKGNCMSPNDLLIVRICVFAWAYTAFYQYTMIFIRSTLNNQFVLLYCHWLRIFEMDFDFDDRRYDKCIRLQGPTAFTPLNVN